MFCHRDLTPAEIARVLGFSNLASELAPTIYHFVPPEVLRILQDGLHSMIADDLNGNWWLDKLVLPDLHALTELEVPEMVFPIQRVMVRLYRGYQGHPLTGPRSIIFIWMVASLWSIRQVSGRRETPHGASLKTRYIKSSALCCLIISTERNELFAVEVSTFGRVVILF